MLKYSASYFCGNLMINCFQDSLTWLCLLQCFMGEGGCKWTIAAETELTRSILIPEQSQSWNVYTLSSQITSSIREIYEISCPEPDFCALYPTTHNPGVCVCVCVWAGGGVDLGVNSRASAPKYRASVSPTTRRRSHIRQRPRHSRPSLSRSHYRLYLASTAWHSEQYHVCSVVYLLSVHSPETWNNSRPPEHDLWPLFLSTDTDSCPLC